MITFESEVIGGILGALLVMIWHMRRDWAVKEGYEPALTGKAFIDGKTPPPEPPPSSSEPIFNLIRIRNNGVRCDACDGRLSDDDGSLRIQIKNPLDNAPFIYHPECILLLCPDGQADDQVDSQVDGQTRDDVLTKLDGTPFVVSIKPPRGQRGWFALTKDDWEGWKDDRRRLFDLRLVRGVLVRGVPKVEGVVESKVGTEDGKETS